MKAKLEAIRDRLNDFLNEAEGYFADNDELVEEGCAVVDDIVDLIESLDEDSQEEDWGEHKGLVERARKAAIDYAHGLWKQEGWSKLCGSYYDVEIQDVDEDEDGYIVEGHIIIGVQDGSRDETRSIPFNYKDGKIELT